MKKKLLFLLCLTSITIINAQSSIGLHFGAGMSYKLVALQQASVSNHFSSSSGIDFYYDIDDGFSLYTGLGIFMISEVSNLRWGTQHNGFGAFLEGDENKTHTFLQFFSIPLGIKYYLTNTKVRLFVQPYVEMDIFLSQYYRFKTGKFQYERSKALPLFPENEPLTYTIATGLGFGAEIDLGKRLSLHLMPEVKLLFTDMATSTGGKTFIPSARLGLSYKL